MSMSICDSNMYAYFAPEVATVIFGGASRVVLSAVACKAVLSASAFALGVINMLLSMFALICMRMCMLL